MYSAMLSLDLNRFGWGRSETDVGIEVGTSLRQATRISFISCSALQSFPRQTHTLCVSYGALVLLQDWGFQHPFQALLCETR